MEAERTASWSDETGFNLVLILDQAVDRGIVAPYFKGRRHIQREQLDNLAVQDSYDAPEAAYSTPSTPSLGCFRWPPAETDIQQFLEQIFIGIVGPLS
jgi:hypothetical protein